MKTNHSARVHLVHWCAFPLVIVKPFRKRKSVLFVIILKERMYTACLGKLFQSWATHTLNRESESESCSVLSDSLQPHGLYSPWNSPGQNSGVGSLSLLQGTFLTQGLNPGLQHCRKILYQLQVDSLQGKPQNTGLVSLSFLQGIFPTRNQTRVSCRAGGFFTNWAIREGLYLTKSIGNQAISSIFPLKFLELIF